MTIPAFISEEQLRGAFGNFQSIPLERLRIEVRRTRAQQLLALARGAPNLSQFEQDVLAFETRTAIGDRDFTGLLFSADGLRGREIKRLQRALKTGSLSLQGNYLWGLTEQQNVRRSKRKPEHNEAELRRALAILEEASLAPMNKVDRIRSMPGFSGTSASGLVMVAYPDLVVICREPTRTKLQRLGLKAKSLKNYQTAVHQLREMLQAQDLFEIDRFLEVLDLDSLLVPPVKSKTLVTASETRVWMIWSGSAQKPLYFRSRLPGFLKGHRDRWIADANAWHMKIGDELLLTDGQPSPILCAVGKIVGFPDDQLLQRLGDKQRRTIQYEYVTIFEEPYQFWRLKLSKEQWAREDFDTLSMHQSSIPLSEWRKLRHLVRRLPGEPRQITSQPKKEATKRSRKTDPIRKEKRPIQSIRSQMPMIAPLPAAPTSVQAAAPRNKNVIPSARDKVHNVAHFRAAVQSEILASRESQYLRLKHKNEMAGVASAYLPPIRGYVEELQKDFELAYVINRYEVSQSAGQRIEHLRIDWCQACEGIEFARNIILYESLPELNVRGLQSRVFGMNYLRLLDWIDQKALHRPDSGSDFFLWVARQAGLGSRHLPESTAEYRQVLESTFQRDDEKLFKVLGFIALGLDREEWIETFSSLILPATVPPLARLVALQITLKDYAPNISKRVHEIFAIPSCPIELLKS